MPCQTPKVGFGWPARDLPRPWQTLGSDVRKSSKRRRIIVFAFLWEAHKVEAEATFEYPI
jgi:hypothetical protein